MFKFVYLQRQTGKAELLLRPVGPLSVAVAQVAPGAPLSNQLQLPVSLLGVLG